MLFNLNKMSLLLKHLVTISLYILILFFLFSSYIDLFIYIYVVDLVDTISSDTDSFFIAQYQNSLSCNSVQISYIDIECVDVDFNTSMFFFFFFYFYIFYLYIVFSIYISLLSTCYLFEIRVLCYIITFFIFINISYILLMFWVATYFFDLGFENDSFTFSVGSLQLFFFHSFDTSTYIFLIPTYSILISTVLYSFLYNLRSHSSVDSSFLYINMFLIYILWWLFIYVYIYIYICLLCTIVFYIIVCNFFSHYTFILNYYNNSIKE